MNPRDAQIKGSRYETLGEVYAFQDGYFVGCDLSTIDFVDMMKSKLAKGKLKGQYINEDFILKALKEIEEYNNEFLKKARAQAEKLRKDNEEQFKNIPDIKKLFEQG